MAAEAAARYTVAVRTLCGFTARSGDLDLRFTPSPTALEGIAGHALVGARRGPGYEREVRLEGRHGPLVVRGRADGYDAEAGCLEEIKTHRGDVSRIPEHHRRLHWAQAKVYGALLCAARGIASLRIAIVYFDIATQQETVCAEAFDAQALREHFEDQCERFVAWGQQEMAHRTARDAALAALAFPHAAFRAGQRPLAAAVYRAAMAGGTLLAQAPTGIGKTVGTLFPMLKAWVPAKLDKLVFLTAKTPGRAIALAALGMLAPSGMPLRTIELVARDAACEHPDRACHGDSCPLARGFYDRLPAARQAAVDAATVLDKAALRRIALAHGVCPYWLGHDLVRWCDVAVGDYNHWFDGTALLHGLAQADGWRVGVLVDEAHNLVERGREMYSAGFDVALLKDAGAAAPPALQAALRRVRRAWAALCREAAGQSDYVALPGVPKPLAQALAQAAVAIADHFAAHPADGRGDGALLRLLFDALHFGRIAETFGDHSVADLSWAPSNGARRPEPVLRLRNVLPAPFLEARFAAAQSSVLFSATLQPPAYYRDTLGLPAETPWVDVASPFAPEQLAVRVVRRVSTRWADRAASVAPIVELIAAQYATRPGNYLAFFSSFDYLGQVADALARTHPQIPAWLQTPGMREAERDAFLARFVVGGCGVGFAVLGGAFGEGIDLVGTRLVGAFVATLGLPPWNPVNEQMKARLEAAFGARRGHDYAYLYPGVRKVVQAAGRVIRTTGDEGVLYLIDDRYARPDVRRLLPAWWRVEPHDFERVTACGTSIAEIPVDGT